MKGVASSFDALPSYTELRTLTDEVEVAESVAADKDADPVSVELFDTSLFTDSVLTAGLAVVVLRGTVLSG